MKTASENNQETRKYFMENKSLSNEFYNKYFYEISAINDLIDNAIKTGSFKVEYISLIGFKKESEKNIFIEFMISLGYKIGRMQTETFYWISWKDL